MVSPKAERWGWCVPEHLVECGLVAEKILETATSRKMNLIVLRVRRFSSFLGSHLPGSTTQQIGSRTLRPVLTIRSQTPNSAFLLCDLPHTFTEPPSQPVPTLPIILY